MIRMVVPHKATAPGDVTILRAPGRRLTKLVTANGIVDYDSPAAFDREAWRIDDIDDLAELLVGLQPKSDRFVIRGVLKPEFADRSKVLRRSRDRPGAEARFVEVPRAWVMIDLEHIACPPGVDPTDPLLVGGVLRRHLPEPFRCARCACQLSSGAGIKEGLRAHLWFVLDRPLVRAELKRWLEPVHGVDLQVFVPVQPHYTAAPIFDGRDDPCTDGRLAIPPGYAEVEVPALPDLERPRPVFAPIGIGNGHRHGGAEAYANACLRRLALAPEGRRHNACRDVCCRLLALSKAGLLDPVRVAGQIKGVMAGKNFPVAETDALLEWAWQTVKPEGLRHG